MKFFISYVKKFKKKKKTSLLLSLRSDHGKNSHIIIKYFSKINKCK